MTLEITLNRFNKQSLIAICSGLTVVTLVAAFFVASNFLSLELPGPEAANNKEYKPFKPEPNFSAAIALLPQDRDLAAQKLSELKSGLSPANDARRIYILAQIDQRSGRAQEALNGYSAINTFLVPFLADRVLLHKAELAGELGQEKVVLEACKTIIRNHASSLSVPAAHYELGRSYMRQSKFSEAEKEFAKLRTGFPASQQAIGAAYYLGQLTNNPQQKNELWAEYLAKSPDGRFATDIITQWNKQPALITAKNKALIGLSYYHSDKKEQALPLMAASLTPDTWLPLAELQIKNKQRVAGLQTLQTALQTYQNSPEYLEGANMYLRNANQDERNAFFVSILSSAPVQHVPYLLWKQSTYQSGEARRTILQKLENTYPSSPWAGRASSEIFWELYKSGQYESAKSFGASALQKFGTLPEMAKVKFWLGKRAEAEGNQQKARGYYNQILGTHQGSYYAYRANGRLQALNGNQDPGWMLSSEPRAGILNNLDQNSDWIWPLPKEEIGKLHPTLQELFALNLWQEALTLMPPRYEKNYPALHAWLLARVENKVYEAIKVSADELYKRRSKLSTDLDHWFIGYPFLYAQYAYASGTRYGFDPIIILALIRQESRFQHKVVSSAKAVGLCQLMPGTAREVARSIGYPSPDSTALCTPSYNIELGAKYLSGLLKQFNGQAQLAIAAYNAGPGSVSKWLKASPNADPDMFVETIPFQETQKYVVSVFENYWVYSNLTKEISGSRSFGNLSQPQTVASVSQSDAIDYPSSVDDEQ
jgi:soluble lytic murein transglycosylase